MTVRPVPHAGLAPHERPVDREQARAEALALANDRRTEHARLKRKVAADRTYHELAELIEGNRGVAGETIRIEVALKAADRIGAGKVTRLLMAAGFPTGGTTKRIGELTPRQRNVLAEALRAFGDRRRRAA